MVGGRKRLAGRVLALLGAAAALYGMVGCVAKPSGDLKSLAVGDMKALKPEDAPAPAPDTPFADAAGKTHTLAEFKGKAVVLNLWATWCGPCVTEMPTLAKLQTEVAGEPVAILPVSLDRDEDLANAKAFIAKRPPLAFYSEPKYALAFAFKPPVGGLPTTLLIDAKGVVRARLSGGADWSGSDARKVIEALRQAG